MIQILISTEERLSNQIVKKLLSFLGLSDFLENVKIQTVKSSWDSSFVDCIVEVYSDGKISKGFLIEITQSTESDSRNTSAYQRLQKFIIGSHYYPNYEKIMYHTEKYHANTDTAKVGLSLCYLMGIRIINVDGDYPKSLDGLQKLKNGMKGPSHNTPLQFWFDEENLTLKISAKLEKSGAFSSDPNIGFVSAIVGVFKDKVDNIIIINHGLSIKHLKSKNKLYKNLYILKKKLKFVFEDEILEWGPSDSIKIPENYYKILEEGEKLSMIRFNDYLENRGNEILFRNIAGCEREKLIVMGKSYTIPKKIKVPDLVFINQKNNIVIIEGECAKNVHKGIIQLGTFDKFIDFLTKIPNFKYNNIIKGVVTDKQVEINDENYLGYFDSSKNNKLNEIIY